MRDMRSDRQLERYAIREAIGDWRGDQRCVIVSLTFRLYGDILCKLDMIDIVIGEAIGDMIGEVIGDEIGEVI